MKWTIERYMLNDKSGWKSSRTRHGEYRVVPCAGGYRVHYRMLRDSAGSTWKSSETVRRTASDARSMAESMEHLFSFPLQESGYVAWGVSDAGVA